MAEHKHYATKMKEEITRLSGVVYDYYEAIFKAQDAIRDRNGLQCRPVFAGRCSTVGDEERIPVRDYEEVCRIIESLPQITP